MAPQSSYVGNAGFETAIETDRQFIEAVLGEVAVAASLTTNAFQVTPTATGGAGYAVDIAPGKLVAKGQDESDQGSYFAWDHEIVTLPWDPPDVLPRYDTLLMVIADSQYGTVSGSQGAQWVIATGTPAASPVVLSEAEIEADWIEPGAYARVADVLVMPGATAFLTSDITMRLEPASSNRIMHLVKEPTTLWPTDNTYIGSTAFHTIGWAGTPITNRLRKRFYAQPNRCYEIEAYVHCVDGSTPTSFTAQIALMYKASPLGTETPNDSDTHIQDGRVMLRNDDNLTNGSGHVKGHLNGITEGYYLVSAQIKSNDSGVGVRCFAPYWLSIKDVGPAV